MKIKYALFASLILLVACSENSDRMDKMKARIDELEKKVNSSYRPGFGEFMGNIQIHHAKLWFAGKNSNWKLADFEVQEIKETLENIEKYETDRVETKSLPMIYPALDSVYVAILNKDEDSFKENFRSLTETCNNCHQVVKYEFNQVKIPENPPFSNQEFKPGK